MSQVRQLVGSCWVASWATLAAVKVALCFENESLLEARSGREPFDALGTLGRVQGAAELTASRVGLTVADVADCQCWHGDHREGEGRDCAQCDPLPCPSA